MATAKTKYIGAAIFLFLALTGVGGIFDPKESIGIRIYVYFGTVLLLAIATAFFVNARKTPPEPPSQPPLAPSITPPVPIPQPVVPRATTQVSRPRSDIDNILDQTRRLEAQAKAFDQTIAPFVPIADSMRPYHVWAPGRHGSGKSTLLEHMIYQDMASGKGVTVIDPAGDLVGTFSEAGRTEGIIDLVPEDRVNDAIFLDLDHPVPINFFHYTNPRERAKLIEQLVEVFKRLSELAGGQWGSRFSSILRSIIVTLLEAKEQGLPVSFLDIHDFIKDTSRRATIIRSAPANAREWNRFPPSVETDPIISRLSLLNLDPSLRVVFGTPSARLNIPDIMNQKKILFVNLGPGTADCILYGTMLVNLMQQEAMRRFRIPKTNRTPHYLYVDEFHRFLAAADFETIITQCRKYNLCLTLANHFTEQLPKPVLTAVRASWTWYVFKIAPEDSPLFHKQLVERKAELKYEHNEHYDIRYPYFLDVRSVPVLVETLRDLPRFHAYHKPFEGAARRILIPPPLPKHLLSQRLRAEYIRRRTLELYAGQPRQNPPDDVESKRDDTRPKPDPFPIKGGKPRNPRTPR